MSDNLERALGVIEGKLDMILEDQKQRNASHDKIHKRLELVERQNQQLIAQQELVEERMDEAEMVSADFRRIKHMGYGIIAAAGVVGALLSVRLVEVAEAVIRIFRSG